MKISRMVVGALVLGACVLVLLAPSFGPAEGPRPAAGPARRAAIVPVRIGAARSPGALGVVVGAASSARVLPLVEMAPADLAFLAEAGRLVGPPPPAVHALIELARGGASVEILRAVIEADLTGDLALAVAARRWVAERAGEPRPEVVLPRPATALVGTFENG